MTHTGILWVDSDAPHADAARGLMGARHPGWRVVHSPSPETARAPLASHAWDAVVLCLRSSDQEPPGLLELCASHPVLLCIDSAQEALAARAFRCGLGDYVLRDADGTAHLNELLHRLAALMQNARGSGQEPGQPARMVDARIWQEALSMLQEQRSALQATLASMSQGILKTGPDERITVYNQRVLELLNLPEALLATRPMLADLTRMQAERGDFGEDYNLVDPCGHDYLAQVGVVPSPALYWRTTRDGRTFEVRTTSLPDGSLVRTFTDVSDYVRVENELRESEARFRSLSDLSSDWYWELDAQGRFVQLVGDLVGSGMALPDVLGRTRWEIGALNMTESDWAAHRAVLAAQQPFRDLELARRHPDGSVYWLSVSGVPLLDASGALRGYRGVGRNITGRKQAESQIERLAFYDALTGLPNRRLLLDRLQRATVAATHSSTQGALLFIDLDNFKDLNDTLGHDIGDQLLLQVAQRLKACVRETDTVARFGGDEFVVLLEGLSANSAHASAETAHVASHIATTLGQPYPLGETSHHSTPSIGIALFGRQPCSVDELLKHADLAMYQAKAAGRNTQRFFDPEMQAAVSSRSALEADLRRGLEQKEQLLYYQPVVDGKGHLQGAEALLRWNHPRRGIVSPAEFIPLAEQTGLILPLGHWVLETACAQLVTWSRSALTRPFFLSVNVSVRQFRQPDFVQQVLGTLDASGANPERLKLELTESLLLADVEDSIARMEQLRSHGVGFSLDDFGTGYSSLSYLKRLPLEQLKIDQSFVRDLQTNPNDAAIVRTILALADSLDLSVVAEGVETTGQFEFLHRHGCKAFQGYLFGRPMPCELLERTLRPAP
ncbi:EAL domain-containing protein [Verminephrobacter aporrectodeae subsp. tuberculatae]|uniref:EAL domain-containing protein n=1 Tax=Verminephrobacter aporrectodeae TaxID=1110389 RepID=UPI002243476B|nr:EAL domain-containing protein [Verminephrobacter aporrectodeae]MCW8200133.1 EAL domain-containing protein [Verminephrobacter aporrectodeae subsp. tuberculatae]